MSDLINDSKAQISKLIDIGISLTRETNLDALLDKILKEAQAFTYADAGSIYIKETHKDNTYLRFKIWHNTTLAKRGSFKAERSYLDEKIPITNKSLAGYVASTGKTLNIKDVYEIVPKLGFEFNNEYDIKNNYRTKSMLITPLRIPDGEIIGVLQLINAMNEKGEAIPFSSVYEELIQSLASQAAVALNNACLNQKLKESYFDTILRLSIAAEYRDGGTSSHIRRMSNYSAIIAKKLGLSKEDVEILQYASPMHDIGKLGIPDSILQKPDKLTAVEKKIMESHTLIGAEILRNPDSQILMVSHKVALTHHEKYDGTGYPFNLKSVEIPIEGRIIALIDVFDALSTRRCYKPAFKIEKVLETIKEEKGKHFDPVCVHAFFDGIDEIMDVFERFSQDNKFDFETKLF